MFSVPILLICSWSSAFFCGNVGIVIFLPFMGTISFLKDQYGCTFFWTPTFIDGHSVHSLTLCLCAHHQWLPVIFLLLSCILGFLYMFFIIFMILSLCLSHGCSWITNLLQISLWSWFAQNSSVVFVIGSLHLFEDHNQWFVICYHASLMSEGVVVELFLHCKVCLEILLMLL